MALMGGCSGWDPLQWGQEQAGRLRSGLVGMGLQGHSLPFINHHPTVNMEEQLAMASDCKDNTDRKKIKPIRLTKSSKKRDSIYLFNSIHFILFI